MINNNNKKSRAQDPGLRLAQVWVQDWASTYRIHAKYQTKCEKMSNTSEKSGHISEYVFQERGVTDEDITSVPSYLLCLSYLEDFVFSLPCF